MSDVVSGEDWVAAAPAEKREEMRESVQRAVAVETGQRSMAPRDVRSADGWATRLDTMAVSDEAVARSGALELVDGVLHVKVRCYSCKRWDRLSCQVPEEDRRVPADAETRRLSPAMVRIAQRWLCEKCSLEDDAAAERSRGVEAVAARLKQSGIPPALAGEVSWESMVAKASTRDEESHRRRAIEVCRAWAAEPKPGYGLLLWGPPGTGKTRLAATTAVARLAHSPLRWVSVGVLMAELAGAWNDEGRKAALKVLTSTAPVVLDDFDKVNPTQGALAQLFTALDKREQAGSPVVVTTNLRPRDLEKKLGGVIVSRLLGMTTVLPFPGPDKRLEIGGTA